MLAQDPGLELAPTAAARRVLPDPFVEASDRAGSNRFTGPPPEVRYAKTNDGVHLAYQVVGEGPVGDGVVAHEQAERLPAGGVELFPVHLAEQGALIELQRPVLVFTEVFPGGVEHPDFHVRTVRHLIDEVA